MTRDKSYFARKKDANHNLIADVLIRAGYRCYDTHKQGNGFPDLVAITRRKIAVFFEIKQKGEKLTDAEDKFHFQFTGILHVVCTPEEALKWMDYYDGFQLEAR